MTPEKAPSKYCRYCGRIIAMDTVNCPYCDRNVIKMPGQKECPVCGEPVREQALKCKHCGEFIDGRAAKAADRQQQPVIYIDKAVIARSEESGELRIEGATPGVRLEPGSEEARHLLGKGGEEPREASGALPGAPDRRALPPGESAGLPTVAARAPLAPPAKAPPEKPKKKPREAKKGPARGEPPAARYECPSCGRYVYEGDNYCENCGRDLAVPAGQREFPGPSEPYRPADYALMVGAAAPAGLLLGPAATVGIAAVGGALGAWSLYRTAGSGGERSGAGRALAAVAAAVFWVVMVAAFAR